MKHVSHIYSWDQYIHNILPWWLWYVCLQHIKISFQLCLVQSYDFKSTNDYSLLAVEYVSTYSFNSALYRAMILNPLMTTHC